jgi:hypothetical protein
LCLKEHESQNSQTHFVVHWHTGTALAITVHIQSTNAQHSQSTRTLPDA